MTAVPSAGSQAERQAPPSRASGVPLYVLDVRAVVSKRGGRIVVMRDGKALDSAPIMRLSRVVLLGAVGITTPALHALLDAGVPVALLRSNGRPMGRIEPVPDTDAEARYRQLSLTTSDAGRLAVAKGFVTGKIANQRALLLRRARDAEHAGQLRSAASLLLPQLARVGSAASLPGLIGLEGGASAIYFSALGPSLNRSGFRRRDRFGPDVVNALLNYCSALLREYVLGAIAVAGLDPTLSFLHTPTRARPTLAFDLMEEWRPVLVESTVLSLLGLGRVTADDIEMTVDGPRLSTGACAAAIDRFHSRVNDTAHSLVSRPGQPTYGQCIHAQALQLREVVLGRLDHYQAFAWR